MSTERSHLLKVIVQPVFIALTAAGAREIVGRPIEVQGEDWHHFAASAFTDDEVARSVSLLSERTLP